MIRKSLPWIAEILVNFLAPYEIYKYLAPHYGDAHALMASSLPPIVWSILEYARKRRIDAVSLLALAGIVLSLLAFIGTGGVQFLQLRENLVTGLVALVFLSSAAIGKPIIYQLARAGMARKSKSHAAHFESLRDNKIFRRTMMIMTLVWGFGMLAQTALACALVFMMPIATYLIVSPILGYGCTAALAGWTFLYARQARRRRQA